MKVLLRVFTAKRMEQIEWILDERNMQAAIKAVKQKKGAAGVDGMTVEECRIRDLYIRCNGREGFKTLYPIVAMSLISFAMCSIIQVWILAVGLKIISPG